jgi:hypothetical protein
VPPGNLLDCGVEKEKVVENNHFFGLTDFTLIGAYRDITIN